MSSKRHKPRPFEVTDDLDAEIAAEPCTLIGVVNCLDDVLNRLAEAVEDGRIAKDTANGVWEALKPEARAVTAHGFDQHAGRRLYRIVLDTLAVLEESPELLAEVIGRWRAGTAAAELVEALR